MILLYGMNGGVVFSADLAVKIAEALCEAHHGAAGLERQRPFVADDRGAYWRVEGSLNRDGKIDGPGAFFLSIEKRDGRVTDLGSWRPVHPHPSIAPLIERHLQEKKQKDRK